jgi:hypothetical protein
MPGPSAAPGTPGPPAAPGTPGPSVVDRYRAGTVTRAQPPESEPDVIDFGPPERTAARQRRMMWWFGGAAGAIVLVGVVVILLLSTTGNGPLHRRTAPPPDMRAPLARLCPPPTAAAQPGLPQDVPKGPRTVDSDSGISYRAYGAPWVPWQTVWTGGTLRLSYRTGQHFVTETYSGGEYHASILSSSVPTATNDALSLDLRCAGRQIAADVRTQYYPQPNTMDLLRDEAATLGGRPAWVTVFRLHFHAEGLRATDELVAVACIDVGRPRAAVLYVSIPGTHRQFDYVVDQVLQSVRPT